ncbi:universal stress protein [Actinoplanes sp. NPDC049596]|uniref:universal stress protein n=1 Tax=unclassified Actinoplanes TaxID=2626549 RepID=UPI0034417039
MSELEKLQTERDARDGRSTRYSEAVDRYLGVGSYRSEEPMRPVVASARTGLVLAGVDDTPTSYIALDHAAIEAELRGWGLRILHAQHSGSLHQPTREDGARLLERLIDRVHASAPTVAVTSRLVVGSAATHLLVAARDAGLVVVGHRHGPASTVFGVSVADRVATDHNGPVLVVRVPGWPPGPGFGRRPIVAGVDGPEDPAGEFARREARLRGSDLVLLYPDRSPRMPRTKVVDGVTTHSRFVTETAAEALLDVSDQAAALVVPRRSPAVRPLLQRARCPVFLIG